MGGWRGRWSSGLSCSRWSRWRRRLRRGRTRQRPAAAATGPGQRRRHRHQRLGPAETGRRRPRTGAARFPRTATSASRRSTPAGPLDLVFVAANLTDIDARLVVRGRTRAASGPLVANANASLEAQPEGRHLHDRGGGHPRRQADPAHRRHLPHVLSERRAAALADSPRLTSEARTCRLTGAWRRRIVTIGDVLLLALAVVVLAAGLIYALVARREEPQRGAGPRAGDPGGHRESGRATCCASTMRRARSTRRPPRPTLETPPGRDQGAGRADRQGPGEDRSRGSPARRNRPPDEVDDRAAGPRRSGTSTPRQPALKKALRQPQTRGQWGELQLRRCVEIAGMTEHVDFELQETLQTEDGRLRPDARFLLPEGRSFVPTPRSRSTRFSTPRRPRTNPSAGSSSSATPGRPASTSALSARRTTRASSRPARPRIW